VVPGSVTSGILDRNNVNNPFRDWTIAVILYCTGDLHAGNGVDAGPNVGQEYNFKGRVNAKVCEIQHHAAGWNFLMSYSP
jgi:hypothetical protein